MDGKETTDVDLDVSWHSLRLLVLSRCLVIVERQNVEFGTGSEAELQRS
jgi:hypothetical protein